MHDPYTTIKNFKLFTLWHLDPEKDGSDDSCGWFKRTRHFDQKLFEKVVSEFEFNFIHNYWFTEDGSPKFSTMGIVLNMYSSASWIINYPKWNRHRNYLSKNLFWILKFAENPVDSLNDAITNEIRYRLIEHDRSQVESRKDRIRHLASVVYSDIMRSMQPWYKHPRWHIHHWRISINWYAFPFYKYFKKDSGHAVSNVDQNLRDTV